MSHLKMYRVSSLSKKTGCLVPCRRNVHRLTELLSYKTDSNPGSTDINNIDWQDDNTTMFAIRIPMDEDTRLCKIKSKFECTGAVESKG